MPSMRQIVCFLTACFGFLTAVFTPAPSYAYETAQAPKPDQTFKIPMRDGHELITDIYLPSADAKNLPCILLRGPGGRHAASAVTYVGLAKDGYVVAIQDSRSVNDPEGKTLPFFSDGWGKQQDGYDTVQWLAQNPVTNGKIGTLGISNMGISQLLMAPTQPPALKCQYIGVAAASLFHHAIFPNGKLMKNQVEGWLGLYAKHPSVLEFVCNRSVYNDFWEGFNTVTTAHRVRVPAVHQGGWFDTFIQGTIDSFVSRQEMGGPGAKGTQKLLIGPWTHRWPAIKTIGDFEVPEEGLRSPYDLSPKRWFDFYLKGVPNKIDETPAVVYYVMGPFDGSTSSGNRWRTADTWPIPHVDTPFYLSSDKKLSEKKPTDKTNYLTYAHDSNDPVPTIGGRNLFLESGPMDQGPIEQRKDVLVFTTEPLEEDLEVTGRVIAKLFFSSDEEDTDISLRLTDVYPDGKSLLIADGIVRTVPCLKKASATQEVDIDLWSTSLVFAKGHKIRIIITGSNYPRFEKNAKMLSGDSKSLHIHNLHMGSSTPSQIILPIVRRGNNWLVPPKQI